MRHGNSNQLYYMYCAVLTSNASENILQHFLDENLHLGVFLQESGPSQLKNTKPKSINLTSLSVYEFLYFNKRNLYVIMIDLAKCHCI